MGWSYREIAAAVGVHFTRVGQILRGSSSSHSQNRHPRETP